MKNKKFYYPLWIIASVILVLFLCIFADWLLGLNIVDSALNAKNKAYLASKGVLETHQFKDDAKFYLKGNRLYKEDIQTGEKICIATNCREFLLTEDNVFYTQVCEDYSRPLFYADYDEKNPTEIVRDASWFCEYKGNIVYIGEHSEDDLDESLFSFSLDIREPKEIYNLYNSKYNGLGGGDYIHLSKNSVIVVRQNEQVVERYFLDYDGVEEIDIKQILPDSDIAKRHEPAMESVAFNDDFIFLSIAAIKDYQFAYHYIESDKNGLWKVNIETGEAEKISDQIFIEVYADNDYVYGIKKSLLSRKLYEFPVETG